VKPLAFRAVVDPSPDSTRRQLMEVMHREMSFLTRREWQVVLYGDDRRGASHTGAALRSLVEDEFVTKQGAGMRARYGISIAGLLWLSRAQRDEPMVGPNGGAA
jgi:hypothetical protein